jgi:hypothetical protein
MNILKKRVVLATAFVAIAFSTLYAANYLVRYTVAGSQQYVLENDGTSTQRGAAKFGDDQTDPTLPTLITADDFGIKMPFYNASGASMSRGQVVLASATATTANYSSVASVLSTTTWVGICDGTVANGETGWMTVSGYAAVLTTATVKIGDILVSTNSIDAGYAGAIAGAATVLEGTVIGRAVSVGTASGGLTIVKLE